jgi:hypothetical protein
LDPLDQIKAVDNPDGHQTLIRSQWRDFAAFAWRQYRERGRGAVVVDLKRAAEQRTTASEIPTYYVADSSRQLQERGGWPNEEISGLIQSYDPEQDVVFLFVRLDGEVFQYNVSDDLTPPKA